jgi:regulator of protease activity HflC (stomatin/prohibitin superfamily)
MKNQNFIRPGRSTGRIFLVIAAVAVFLLLLSSTFVFIPPQTSGVVISLLTPGGYRKQPMQSGLHMIAPFVEHVEKYPVWRQTYTMSVAPSEGQIQGDDSIRARTKDGQEVFIDASIIFSIDPAKVVQLHINWQDRYEAELIRPAARNAIRDAVSQYGVEEIVSTKRAEMEDAITKDLAAKLSDNDLLLVGFLLRDIHFSDEYAAAVEQKQIAEQQAQQAKLIVEQRKQEAEQARQVAQGQADAAVIAAQGAAQARVIQAQAESEALGLLAAALKDHPELLQYQYINQLAPGVQTIFVPSGNQFILTLPTTSAPTPAPAP